MEEFQRQIAKGFIIERVNLTQATIAEAVKFKKHLETDISLGYKIIIIDLSNCNSLDSAFIGVLVVTLKQLMRLGGSIKIVKPGMFSESMLNLTGTIEIFELYDSLDCAITSISVSAERSSNTLNDFSTNGLDRLAVVH
ncbi:MAG: STAS domain-containing protein [Ignavibacteriota bacterium]